MTAIFADAQHVRHRLRLTPSRSASALPRARGQRDLEQLGLVPGRRRAGRRAAPRPASARGGRAASGTLRSGGGARRPQHEAHDLLVAERLGAGELVARALRVLAAPSSAITQSATSSAQIGWNERAPEPLGRHHGQQRHPRAAASATGRPARRRSRARRPSCAARTRPRPARRAPWRAASACGRARVAPSAEKKTKRSTPARSAASTMRHVAMPLSSSIEPRGLVADRRGEVHDRVDAAHRVAERRRVGEVAERDLDPHALGAQPARVADQAAHRARRRPR